MLAPTIHASAVLFGHRGILIRGPSGSGKSRLALSVLQSGGGFARLVGDDRLHVDVAHGRLLMRPPQVLAGLIEVRGLGIVRLPYEPVAVAHLVVDLAAPDAVRLPDPSAVQVEIDGVRLARLPVAAGANAVPLLMAFCHTAQNDSARLQA